MQSTNDGDPVWVQRLSQCTGGHHESTLAVAEGLVIEMPDVLRRLKVAIAESNNREVQRLAHTLKSSIKYVSEGPDLTSAAEVEVMGKESRIEDASAAVLQLEEIVRRWVKEIQRWLDSQS